MLKRHGSRVPQCSLYLTIPPRCPSRFNISTILTLKPCGRDDKTLALESLLYITEYYRLVDSVVKDCCAFLECSRALPSTSDRPTLVNLAWLGLIREFLNMSRAVKRKQEHMPQKTSISSRSEIQRLGLNYTFSKQQYKYMYWSSCEVGSRAVNCWHVTCNANMDWSQPKWSEIPWNPLKSFRGVSGRFDRRSNSCEDRVRITTLVGLLTLTGTHPWHF